MGEGLETAVEPSRGLGLLEGVQGRVSGEYLYSPVLLRRGRSLGDEPNERPSPFTTSPRALLLFFVTHAAKAIESE